LRSLEVPLIEKMSRETHSKTS